MKWSELNYVDKISHQTRVNGWGLKEEDFLIEFELSFKGLEDLESLLGKDILKHALAHFAADLDVHIEKIGSNFPYKEADLSFEVDSKEDVECTLRSTASEFCPVLEEADITEFILIIEETFKKAIENWEEHEQA